MDPAVEAHLHAELAAIATESEDPDGPARNWSAELDALAAVGLIDAGQRAEWEARLDEAIALLADPPPPPPEVLERVRRYLRKRVGKLERGFSWRHPYPEEEVAAEVIALHAAGVLDDAEESRWLDRIAAAEGDDRLRLGDLRAVVAPAIPPVEHVTVTAVELWSGAVVVRFTYEETAPLSDEFTVGFWEFELSDDAGTEYGGVASGFSPSDGRRGDAIFIPGAPRDAHTMRVHHGDATFDFPLTW